MSQKSKLFIIALTISCSFGNIMAQEDDSPFSIGVDIASRYIWRGINLGGSSPSIQPYLEYGFGSDDHSFTVGVWGAYSMSGNLAGQEADIYLSYGFKNIISLTLTDYFFPNENSGSYKYFNYNTNWDKIDSGEEEQTGHLLEAALAFNGTERIPLSLMFAINIWGADSRKYEDQNGTMVALDKIVMSKYLELGYSTGIAEMGLDLFAGMALDSPDTENGEPTGFYGQDNIGLINLGATLSKEIKVTESFSVPAYASFILNPEAGNVFIVFGMSL